MRRSLAFAIAVIALVTGLSGRGISARSGQCSDPYVSSNLVREAEEILAGRINVGVFGPVELGLNLTWLEDPHEDANWRYRLHNMRWTEALRRAYQRTGKARYLEAWRRIWLDWMVDNPLKAPPSEASWDDHTTALRAKILACAAMEHPEEKWVRVLLADHGKHLAREDLYVGSGNHALNHAQGLLSAGCVLGNRPWVDQALRWIDPLAAESITANGATNEGSISYAIYNFLRYDETLKRMEGCATSAPPHLVERLPKLARFIAHATLPNGEIPLIGDSNVKRPQRWYSPEVAYAVSLGREGVVPGKRSVLYNHGGWAFGRTSWSPRAMQDSVAYALRTGHASRIHAHDDHGHLSVFGHGRRLLEDSGLYGYTNPLNKYFTKPPAHNVVVVEPAYYKRRVGSNVERYRHRDRWDYYDLRLPVWSGTRWTRRIVFARDAGWFLVDDRLSANSPRTFTQTWHLTPDADPVVEGPSVRSRFDQGNVALTFLNRRAPSVSVVTGREEPMQGFIAYEYGDRQAAPAVEARYPAVTNRARFVTLISTHAGADLPVVRGLSITRHQLTASITVGERTDAITWAGNRIQLRCIAGC